MDNGNITETKDPPAEENRDEKHDEGREENRRRSSGNQSSNGSMDNVDKIRDLIFGEQMAGYEARFNALESRLVAEVDSLRESVEARLAELKNLTEKRASEVETLSVSRRKLGDSLQRLAETIRE